MTVIHSTLLVLHILLGSGALVLFWIPIFTEKGKLNHRKFGKYYKNIMYGIAASGAVMSIIVLMNPLEIKGHLSRSSPDELVQSVRIFWAFLLYLSLLSYTTTRHAIAVLNARNEREKLRKLNYVLPIAMLALIGPYFLYLGIEYNRTLHTVFGILGTIVGADMLRYCYRKRSKQREWVIEHLGAMLGSGIGAYTAFLAFGGRVLFANLGEWQMVFWIAPGVIGSIASYLLSKKYKKVFSVA